MSENGRPVEPIQFQWVDGRLTYLQAGEHADDDYAELRKRVRELNEKVRGAIQITPGPAEVDDDAGQCLRYAAAATLRVPPDTLPRLGDGDDRFDTWAREMLKLGYQVEYLDEIPPADGQPWIAVVDATDGAAHALGMIGLTVIHDDYWSTVRAADVLVACRITTLA